MVCEMGDDYDEDMDIEGVSSMWPEDVGSESGKRFTMEKPGLDKDMLEEVTITEDISQVDFKRLLELTNYSEKGSSQLVNLVKNWEYKQSNAVRLLNEELDILSRQRQEVELKKLEILEDHQFEGDSGDKRPISILDDVYDIWEAAPRRKSNVVVQNKRIEIDAEYDTITYWKQRAMELEKLLEASVQREQTLMEKLQENIKTLERQSSPVEEFSQILKRADNFLHFVLQNAPVVIGHQDKDLRYRFIYNHFPSLQDEDIIGKTDVEIFTGAGVKESQDFKREVMQRGQPGKREITFDTGLFGSKTFLIYVEPVFSKAGDTIGVNYMGMEISDQVLKRERMATLREEIAVQKAKETELNKTIHITEETMRAKQMLATMSHEIRSPLTGVVSMAEILSNSKLDREQRQLLDVMISSGDLVLQLINDILDLSKVESGVMRLEATKFRPREVVKHVLQTAAASLQKELTLEGHVAEGVPVEVIGDVLRIRQILTNLISNAIKFTHEGRVGINLYVVPDPEDPGKSEEFHQNHISNQSVVSENHQKEKNCSEASHDQTCNGCLEQNGSPDEGPSTPVKHLTPADESQASGTAVWIRCDVYDTGIGIPEKAIPTLFKKYMQVSADHARKYGGTGLGLAICKQLVELMGGSLTVTTKEHCGSTFTFLLPYKISLKREPQDGTDELYDMEEHEIVSDANNDDTVACYFNFRPRTLGSLFSSAESMGTHKPPLKSFGYDPLNKLKIQSEKPYSFLSSNCISRESDLDACSVTAAVDSFSDIESSLKELEPSESYALCGGKTCLSNSSILKNPKMDSHDYGETCMGVDNKDKPRESHVVCQGQEQETRSSQIRSCSSTESPKSDSKPRILLVEDNKINVMVAKSMIKQFGHDIDVVNDGVEAVRAVQTHNYDLVLMDVCMPVMDGLQATRLIRSFEETGSWDAAVEAGIDQLEPSPQLQPNCIHAVPSRKRVPIIAMTANSLAESADECLANGMDSFISKPVTSQKLKECLQQYIPC
ncbi:Histidine kinase [Thalictrum thalictroides]|uniref:histidine kinase n=1 Tax=Thalictrum thalictroides TaxID=46969 RepID=A0A7J6UXG1_THATH|nr:Histidine kinase [Thalictrum thalictroides]